MSRSEEIMSKLVSDTLLQSDELVDQFKDYEDDVLKASEKELEMILDLNKIEEWAESITFDQLTKLTFDKAHRAIGKISMKNRIKLLNELDRRLVYLYECTKGYNDIMFGKSMPPKDFFSIMGKIKHLEIIQNWLFGIE
jgi:hypothetical protein